MSNKCIYDATGNYICNSITPTKPYICNSIKSTNPNIYNISKNQQQNKNTTNIDNNIIISSINPISTSTNQNKVNNPCKCNMNNYK